MTVQALIQMFYDLFAAAGNKEYFRAVRLALDILQQLSAILPSTLPPTESAFGNPPRVQSAGDRSEDELLADLEALCKAEKSKVGSAGGVAAIDPEFVKAALAVLGDLLVKWFLRV